MLLFIFNIMESVEINWFKYVLNNTAGNGIGPKGIKYLSQSQWPLL